MNEECQRFELFHELYNYIDIIRSNVNVLQGFDKKMEELKEMVKTKGFAAFSSRPSHPTSRKRQRSNNTADHHTQSHEGANQMVEHEMETLLAGAGYILSSQTYAESWKPLYVSIMLTHG